MLVVSIPLSASVSINLPIQLGLTRPHNYQNNSGSCLFWSSMSINSQNCSRRSAHFRVTHNYNLKFLLVQNSLRRPSSNIQNSEANLLLIFVEFASQLTKRLIRFPVGCSSTSRSWSIHYRSTLFKYISYDLLSLSRRWF